MSSAPAGAQAIMARIATLRSGPSRMAEIQDRFGWNLSKAVALAQQSTAAAGDATATAASSGNFTQSPAGAGVATSPLAEVAAAAAAPTTSASSTVATSPVVPTPTGAGGWVDRLPASAKPWVNEVQAAAEQNGLDPAFMAAVFWTESNYRPQVVSEAGAIGMGQLMPATAEWLGVDPLDPAQNMQGSAKYYRNLLDRFGSLELATASYFAGPGAVSKAGGIPSDRAQNYVDKVLGRRDYLNGTRDTPP